MCVRVCVLGQIIGKLIIEELVSQKDFASRETYKRRHLQKRQQKTTIWLILYGNNASMNGIINLWIKSTKLLNNWKTAKKSSNRIKIKEKPTKSRHFRYQYHLIFIDLLVYKVSSSLSVSSFEAMKTRASH